jgi:hypothetical protein
MVVRAERVAGAVRVAVHSLRKKKRLRFEFPFCLSRACLGKMIVYRYILRKRRVFHTLSGARSGYPKVALVVMFGLIAVQRGVSAAAFAFTRAPPQV